MKLKIWIGLWIFIVFFMLADAANFFKIPFDKIPLFIRLIFIAICPASPIGLIILIFLDNGDSSPGLLAKTWNSLGQNTILNHLEAKRLSNIEGFTAILAFFSFGGITTGSAMGKICFVLFIIFTPISLIANKVLKNSKIKSED